MIVLGKVVNGEIVLEEPIDLPDGTEVDVKIITEEEANEIRERLKRERQ